MTADTQTEREAAWERYELAHDALDKAIDESTSYDDHKVSPALKALEDARLPVEAAAHAVGRGEAGCAEPQGDGTPCVINHEGNELNHTSASVLLSDYADIDKCETRIEALEGALRDAADMLRVLAYENSVETPIILRAEAAARALLSEGAE